MKTQLLELFSSIEIQRETLINQLRDISHDKLNTSTSNKWSINQIISHIITSERLSLSYMTKKINAIDEVGNTGIWGEIKLFIFIVSQRVPLKNKAPKVLGEKPSLYPDINSLEQDWIQVRHQLKMFLEKFPSHELRKKIYRHPVMGRCNVVHALKFFREHIIHHYPQIKRQL